MQNQRKMMEKLGLSTGENGAFSEGLLVGAVGVVILLVVGSMLKNSLCGRGGAGAAAAAASAISRRGGRSFSTAKAL